MNPTKDCEIGVIPSDLPEDSSVEGDIPPVKEDNTHVRRRAGNRLSIVSQQYDVGNKGFLDETERIIREYDTNNDGTLDINEVS